VNLPWPAFPQHFLYFSPLPQRQGIKAATNSAELSFGMLETKGRIADTAE